MTTINCCKIVKNTEEVNEEECAKCDGGGTDFCDCNESEEETDEEEEEEEVNEETEHYILYGEWKIYDKEGNYHCKTGDIELYKTLEEATESFNKMIEEEKNGDKNDYDLIYLDCMEEEDDFEEGDELYQCNVDCWEKPLRFDGDKKE
tara:strand:- start:485 stop:928 length:444 start_codon:yes stop_codon:yes gene_type:complete